MIIEILIGIFLGVAAGTFTGLIPGIHTNLISIILITLSSTIFKEIEPIFLAVFITAMSLTHTFLDFIPSIYLGAPDEETALAIMPGHEFLLKGKAHSAVKLTLLGSLSSIGLLIIIIPAFFIIIPSSIGIIEKMMGWILIWVSIFLITDQKNKKLKNLIVFSLAGFLGFQSLNMAVSQPLLPLLTGLFGTSTIIYSINSKIIPPKQKIEKLNLNLKSLLKPLLATTLISPVCSLLPGLGASQAAIISSKVTGDLDKKQFLILLGSINTLVLISSFFTYYLTNKVRTGTVSAVSTLLEINFGTLKIIVITVLLSSLFASIITIYLSKNLAKNLHKLNYKRISQGILTLLVIITFIISGIGGILILVTATLLGLFSTYFGVRKSLLMGCLMIPTIIYYLPF